MEGKSSWCAVVTTDGGIKAESFKNFLNLNLHAFRLFPPPSAKLFPSILDIVFLLWELFNFTFLENLCFILDQLQEEGEKCGVRARIIW